MNTKKFLRILRMSSVPECSNHRPRVVFCKEWISLVELSQLGRERSFHWKEHRFLLFLSHRREKKNWAGSHFLVLNKGSQHIWYLYGVKDIRRKCVWGKQVKFKCRGQKVRTLESYIPVKLILKWKERKKTFSEEKKLARHTLQLLIMLRTTYVLLPDVKPVIQN